MMRKDLYNYIKPNLSKKSGLTNSASLLSCAKNDTSIENDIKKHSALLQTLCYHKKI